MALPVTDTWSQSSGSTQGIATYGAYEVLEGSMSILSGTPGVSVGSGAYNTARRTDETFNAAQYSQVVVTANQISQGMYCGPAVRCQSGENTSYHVETNGSVYYVSKCVAGTQTTLAGPISLSFDSGGGDILYLDVDEIAGTTTLGVYKALAASPTSFTLHSTYPDTVSPITNAGTAGVFGYGNSGTTPVIGTWTAGNLAAADTTAPTLTSQTGTATGSTTADGTVSTDEANGTAYAVVTTSATAPTAAQVRAGQDNTGTAAAWSGSQAVSTTGTKTFNATGLTASTAYYFHFHHRDAANNDSTVVSSAQFTTSSGVTTVCNPITGRGGSAAQPLAS